MDGFFLHVRVGRGLDYCCMRLNSHISSTLISLYRVRTGVPGIATFLALLSAISASASFGVFSSGGNYIVDSGAGLVFKVSQSSGDINSIVFNGVEYQSASKNSHIASGLGTDTSVSATTYG